MANRPLLWEQTRIETREQYQAFRCYLGVPGRRSFKEARRRAREMSLACGDYAESTWGAWCADQTWVKRAEQWDAHVYRMAREIAAVTALALVPRRRPASAGS